MLPSAKDSEIFVGRSKEIACFFDFLNRRNCPAFVLIGEPGIGKTSFLHEVSRKLERQDKYIVGFHEVLFSADVANPFVGAIQSLLEQLAFRDETQVDVVLKQIKASAKNLIKKKAHKIASALLKDAVARLLGNHVTDELEKLKNELDKTPTVFSLTNKFISEHKGEFVYNFLKLVETLQAAFGDKEFVFIIDQFERAPLSSCKILLDFANTKVPNTHIVVGLKTEEKGFKKFAYLKPNIERMGAVLVELKPLTVKEIADWMNRLDRKFTLPELKMIKNLSGGFPFTISEWIKKGEKSSIAELQEVRGKYCEFIKWRIDSLEREQNLFVRKLAVLEAPLPIADYQRLSGIEPETCSLILQELEEKGILSKHEDSFWFAHELIRFCIERLLNNAENRYYHKKAAEFFLFKFNTAIEKKEEIEFETLLGCAHHCHYAENLSDSVKYNHMVFHYSISWGLLEYAEKAANYGLEDAKRLNDELNETAFMNELASAYENLGRGQKALELEKEALSLAKRIGDPEKISLYLSNIGLIEQELGHYDEAIRFLQESISLREKAGFPKLASSVYYLGIIQVERGNHEEAQKLLNQSLELATKDKDQKGIANVLHALGNIQGTVGHYDVALELYERVLKIRTKMHDPIGLSEVLYQIGCVKYLQDDLDVALTYLIKSLEISSEIGDKSRIVNSLSEVAEIFRKKGKYEKAMKMLRRALKLATEIGQEKAIGLILLRIATIEYNLGNYTKCLQTATKGFKISTKIGSKETEAQAHYLLALVNEQLNNLPLAALHFSQSLTSFEEMSASSEDIKESRVGFDRVMKKLQIRDIKDISA